MFLRSLTASIMREFITLMIEAEAVSSEMSSQFLPDYLLLKEPG
jgi:hypothetical protein